MFQVIFYSFLENLSIGFDHLIWSEVQVSSRIKRQENGTSRSPASWWTPIKVGQSYKITNSDRPIYVLFKFRTALLNKMVMKWALNPEIVMYWNFKTPGFRLSPKWQDGASARHSGESRNPERSSWMTCDELDRPNTSLFLNYKSFVFRASSCLGVQNVSVLS